jgi:DNA-binding NarL/FixJ family response regulator
VEPDAVIAKSIQRACADIAQLISTPTFEGARSHLLESPPDVLVTNLRLEEYNGLHLVLLVVNAGTPTRCLVHTNRPDLYLARQIQALGAFFEHTERLEQSLPSYIRAALPENDRRDPDCYDRRNRSRGGRRSADQHASM